MAHILCGKIACREDVHRKWAKWNGMSIPFYPAEVEWNGNPFHFPLKGNLACREKWHVTPGTPPRSANEMVLSQIFMLEM